LILTETIFTEKKDASITNIYSQLLIIWPNGGGRHVMDNPKPRLKQKQSKHGTKWIFLVKKMFNIQEQTIQQTSSKSVEIRYHNKRLQ
jgi:hypothetical protein